MTSSPNIHPTAIIEPGAILDPSVSVGAYAYIGAQVKIGKNSLIHHHATVEGNTVLGESNVVFPYAVIGGMTHDLKYSGGAPGLLIGNHNTFREYVTVHVATKENDSTIIGNHNVILAYSHVAHDCVVGDHLIMSSHSALAGHVTLGNHVNVGWNVGVHQFCRIGDFVMLGAASKIVQDVLPYMLADGNPAVIRTFNKIGLERNNFSSEDLDAIKFVFQVLYKKGLNKSQAFEVLQEHPSNAFAQKILSFSKNSTRGIL